jgi:hypothetical protein
VVPGVGEGVMLAAVLAAVRRTARTCESPALGRALGIRLPLQIIVTNTDGYRKRPGE